MSATTSRAAANSESVKACNDTGLPGAAARPGFGLTTRPDCEG